MIKISKKNCKVFTKNGMRSKTFDQFIFLFEKLFHLNIYFLISKFWIKIYFKLIEVKIIVYYLFY